MVGIDEGKEKLPQDTPNSIKIKSLKYWHIKNPSYDSNTSSTADHLRSELIGTYYSTGYHTHIVVQGDEDIGGRTSAK